MKVDEAALVREIVEGNTEAFKVIVEQHQTRVFYLGLKFLKDREEAEDFAQEVFLKAFERIDTYRGNGSFSGWLYRIAFNLAATKYRAGRRFLTESWDDERDPQRSDGLQARDPTSTHSTITEVVADSGGHTGGVEYEVLRAELVEEVNQVLKRIPGRFALLVKMHFYDGLTYPEISEILNMPINTIKSYIHRAKKAIRKLLTGRGYVEAQ